MTTEERQEVATSVKHGFCKAMAESGLSPSETEDILKKTAVAGVFGGISAVKDILTPMLVTGLGVGALAGVGTASLRSKLENMADGTEDESMRKSRMKVDFYKKMINDLKTEAQIA
jgi:hypothetical protein